MAGEGRLMEMSSKVMKIASMIEVETQRLRASLIMELEQLFRSAARMAKSSENREEWMRIAGYIAQIISGLARSFDEIRLNEDIQRLREMIERAKEKIGSAGTGAKIA